VCHASLAQGAILPVCAPRSSTLVNYIDGWLVLHAAMLASSRLLQLHVAGVKCIPA
jgi:hypothetical protein